MKFCVLLSDFTAVDNLHGAESSWTKLTGSQLVKKFPAFYRTRKFITAFTDYRHKSLSPARSIQLMPPSQFLKIHFNIIFLDLQVVSCPSDFSTKTLYAPSLSTISPTCFFPSHSL
jgi:hypothetical protein